MNILLTGKPGVGKTTLIKKIAEKIECSGFYTEEIRENDRRVGFKIKTLDGEEGILAHINEQGPKVSKYHVNLSGLKDIAVKSIEKAIESGKFVLIDECGKMELKSDRFKKVFLKSLDEGKVIGTIGKGVSLFQQVKERQDVKIIEVTVENRDNLADKIVRDFL